MWNTNDDRYANFGHFTRKKSLKIWKHLYVARALSIGQCGILTMIDTPILTIFENVRVETSLHRNVSTFFYVIYLWKVWKRLYVFYHHMYSTQLDGVEY